MQWDLAKTNASMAIFLGKNILGQRDNPEQDGTDAMERLTETVEAIKGAVENENH